jgi:hypothetical protein
MFDQKVAAELGSSKASLKNESQPRRENDAGQILA